MASTSSSSSSTSTTTTIVLTSPEKKSKVSKRCQQNEQHQHGEGSRVPTALQAVFIASNRGNNVDKPPPLRTAFRMFLSSPKEWLKGNHHSKQNKSSKSEMECFKVASSSSRPLLTKKKSTSSLSPFSGTKSQDTIPVEASSSRLPKRMNSFSIQSPQQYLESILKTRGYSTECYSVLNSGYYNKPTPLQKASYGVFMVDVVQRNDADTLFTLLSLGLHPNACSPHGESIVHLACRRGNYQALQIMLDFDCSIQVSDDYGRTPLHVLCWTAEPSFQAVAMILEIDRRLFFMTDRRGASPLAYTRREDWPTWIKFIESRKDEYWPKRGRDFQEGPPKLTQYNPNSRSLPNPENALSLALTEMVAAGKIQPEEAEILRDDRVLKKKIPDMESITEITDSYSDDDDEDDDDDDNDDDDDENDDSAYEQENILNFMNTFQRVQVSL